MVDPLAVKEVKTDNCIVNLCTEMNNCNNCPANSYLFNDNNRNTRKRCEICSKLTIKSPERRQ